MKENNFCVYMHKNKINGKVYIGKTNNISNRWRNNGIAYKPYERKNERPFWNAICKYGWDNFEHIILFDNLSDEEACTIEKKCIAEYNSRDRKFGYNVAEGGNGGRIYKEHPKGMLGKTHSEDKKKQQKEWMSNKENNCMTNGQVIWGVTHEHPKGMLGKTHSEDKKKQISQTMKDKGVNTKKIIAIMPNGEEIIFNSLIELQNKLRISSTISYKLLKSGQPYKLSKHVTNNREVLEKLEGLRLFYYKHNTEVTNSLKAS